MVMSESFLLSTTVACHACRAEKRVLVGNARASDDRVDARVLEGHKCNVQYACGRLLCKSGKRMATAVAGVACRLQGRRAQSPGWTRVARQCMRMLVSGAEWAGVCCAGVRYAPCSLG